MDDEISISMPKRTSLVHQCVKSILEYIGKSAMQLGDQLPSHQELASRMGVSVLVVREALQALNALGLVDVRHGQGTFVRGFEEADFLGLLSYGPLGNTSMRDVAEARAMLDLTALEACIANAGPAEITRLEEAVAKMRHPRDPSDSGDYHILFHRELLRCSGNQLLYAIGVPLINTFFALASERNIPPVDPETLRRAEDHSLIVNAIKNRDLAHACEVIDLHMLHMPSRFHFFPFYTEADARSPKGSDRETR